MLEIKDDDDGGSCKPVGTLEAKVTNGSNVVGPLTAPPNSNVHAIDGDLLMKSNTVALRGPIPPIVKTTTGPFHTPLLDC